MDELNRIGLFHIARMLLTLNGWFMLMNFCVSGAICKPAPENETWMARDTRNKARLCLLLYGIAIPTMVLSALYSSHGFYRSPVDAEIAVCTAVSAILAVVSILGKCNKLRVHDMVNMLSYIFPATVIIFHIVKYRSVL